VVSWLVNNLQTELLGGPGNDAGDERALQYHHASPCGGWLL